MKKHQQYKDRKRQDWRSTPYLAKFQSHFGIRKIDLSYHCRNRDFRTLCKIGHRERSRICVVGKKEDVIARLKPCWSACGYVVGVKGICKCQAWCRLWNLTRAINFEQKIAMKNQHLAFHTQSYVGLSTEMHISEGGPCSHSQNKIEKPRTYSSLILELRTYCFLIRELRWPLILAFEGEQSTDCHSPL